MKKLTSLFSFIASILLFYQTSFAGSWLTYSQVTNLTGSETFLIGNSNNTQNHLIMSSNLLNWINQNLIVSNSTSGITNNNAGAVTLTNSGNNITGTFIGNATSATSATTALTAGVSSNLVSGASITNATLTGNTTINSLTVVSNATFSNVTATNFVLLSPIIGDASGLTNWQHDILIAGANVTITSVTNSSTGQRTNMIAASGGGGGSIFPSLSITNSLYTNDILWAASSDILYFSVLSASGSNTFLSVDTNLDINLGINSGGNINIGATGSYTTFNGGLSFPSLNNYSIGAPYGFNVSSYWGGFQLESTCPITWSSVNTPGDSTVNEMALIRTSAYNLLLTGGNTNVSYVTSGGLGYSLPITLTLNGSIQVTNGIASYTAHIPVAVTVGASTFNFTNNAPVALECYFSDAAAYSVSKNGVAVYQSLAGDDYFVLQPGSKCGITYLSTTPAMLTNSW